MNERIRGLAEQASFSWGHIVAEVIAPDYSGPELHLLVDAFNSLPREIRDHISQSLIKNQQKFAELIVAECEKAIRAEIAVTDISGEVEKAWEMGMECGVYTIKKHFGVE